jgi:hypothetical protein
MQYSSYRLHDHPLQQLDSLPGVIHGAAKSFFIISLLFLLITSNVFALCNHSTRGHLLARLQRSLKATKTWLRVPIVTEATGVLIPSRITP